MGLEWLGKYRGFVGKLMKFGNAYARTYNDENRVVDSPIKLSSAQIQTLECIIENEENNRNMAALSAMLGMTPSAFSKNVNKMMGKGLLEKYQASNNKKDIIVRVSDFGKKIYEQYADHALEAVFNEMFEKLDEIPEQYLEKFAEILEIAADATFKPNLPTLIKL